jgi:hypothetical protein
MSCSIIEINVKDDDDDDVMNIINAEETADKNE